MTNSVSEADRLNLGEKKRWATWTAEGARPKRKKGFYRALKRGELWARIEAMHRGMTVKLAGILYHADETFLKRSTIFTGLVGNLTYNVADESYGRSTAHERLLALKEAGLLGVPRWLLDPNLAAAPINQPNVVSE